MLVIPFYVFYDSEFLMRFLQYKDGSLAYRNISFEREFYTHEVELDYLKQRPF